MVVSVARAVRGRAVPQCGEPEHYLLKASQRQCFSELSSFAARRTRAHPHVSRVKLAKGTAATLVPQWAELADFLSPG